MILCKRSWVLLLTFLILFTIKTSGQDAHFSQFYANPLYLNPAFAGANNCPRFAVNFRDQYPSIPGNFLTFSGSYDQYIYAIRSGIGVLVSADLAGGGLLSTYNASAIYSFRAQVAYKFNLHFALQAGYMATQVNWDKMKYASEIIESINPNYQPQDVSENLSKSQFDAAFGFIGYNNYLYFGFALHHLFPVQVSFFKSSNDKFKTKWEPKVTTHIGGKITISQKRRNEINTGDIFLYPNLVFISQGPHHYLHEGFYFNFYPFTIGAWLRHNFKNLDALIVSCGIEYKLLRIGYSYDFTLTKLEGTGGAHEVSLQITIPCDDTKSVNKKRKKTKHSPVECPRF